MTSVKIKFRSLLYDVTLYNLNDISHLQSEVALVTGLPAEKQSLIVSGKVLNKENICI